MSGIEGVRLLLRIMAWERTVFAPIFACDIDALPLNEMSRQANPRMFIVECAQRETRIEEAEQPVKGSFIATVRRGGEENEMALRIIGKALQKLEPLLPALM